MGLQSQNRPSSSSKKEVFSLYSRNGITKRPNKIQNSSWRIGICGTCFSKSRRRLRRSHPASWHASIFTSRERLPVIASWTPDILPRWSRRRWSNWSRELLMHRISSSWLNRREESTITKPSCRPSTSPTLPWRLTPQTWERAPITPQWSQLLEINYTMKGENDFW